MAIASWVATADTYNDFTLNSSGITGISKTGITKFGLREENDRANTDSATNNNNRIDFRAADAAGTTSDPKLTGTSAAATVAAGGTIALLLGVGS